MSLLCKIKLHRYETIEDTGVTVYKECKSCGKRKYYQRPYLTQPVDKKWVRGEKEEIGLFNEA